MNQTTYTNKINHTVIGSKGCTITRKGWVCSTEHQYQRTTEPDNHTQIELLSLDMRLFRRAVAWIIGQEEGKLYLKEVFNQINTQDAKASDVNIKGLIIHNALIAHGVDTKDCYEKFSVPGVNTKRETSKEKQVKSPYTPDSQSDDKDSPQRNDSDDQSDTKGDDKDSTQDKDSGDQSDTKSDAEVKDGGESGAQAQRQAEKDKSKEKPKEKQKRQYNKRQ